MKNRLREARKKAGLTQAALATKVGTSQQQIQRIEQGQSARLDLAVRIAGALAIEIEKLFPGLKPVLKKLGKDEASYDQVQKARKEFGDAGIDVDPEHWFVKLRLTSGVERVYPVSGTEKSRVWSHLQHGAYEAGHASFVLIQSDAVTAAVNRSHLAYVHFLYEVGPFMLDGEEEAGDDFMTTVYFGNEKEPVEFEIPPDGPPADDDDSEGQARAVFFELEHDPDVEDVLILRDIDEENAVIRIGSIALLELPTVVTAREEPDDEEEAAIVSGS